MDTEIEATRLTKMHGKNGINKKKIWKLFTQKYQLTEAESPIYIDG